MGRRRAPAWTAVVLSVIVTTAASVLVLRLDPLLSIAAIAAIPVFVGLLLKSWMRLATVVIGALVVFQAPSDELKYGYLALAILCVAVSAVQLLNREDAAVALFRPVIVASLILFVFLVASLFIAQANGATASNWLRDVLPYLLFSVLPVVGLDASRDVSLPSLERLIGVLGVLGAIGVAVDWLDRRGVSSLGFGRIILSTFVLVALAFSLGLVRAGLGPKRLVWLLAVISMAAAMLISGSRTNLILFASVVAVLGLAANARVNPLRMAANVAVAVGLTVLAVSVIASTAISEPGFVQNRLGAAMLVIQGGATGDLSFIARQASYEASWHAFLLRPILGTGPGYLYPNGLFGSDAATLILAKWGVVGSLLLLGFLITVVICAQRSRTLTGPAPIHTALFGWAVVLVASLPFGPWLEDKGFALALTLAIAAVAASTRNYLAHEPKVSVGTMPTGVTRSH